MGDSSKARVPPDERKTAGFAYFVWPLALALLFQVSDEPRSEWLMHHARQAAFLGLIVLIAFLGIFSVPLLLVVFGGLSLDATISVYGISFFLDLVFLALATLIAMTAARRAARGERFTLLDHLQATWTAMKQSLPHR